MWIELACPSCPAGEAAREQVWQLDFGPHLTAVVLPFAFVLLLSRWFERKELS